MKTILALLLLPAATFAVTPSPTPKSTATPIAAPVTKPTATPKPTVAPTDLEAIHALYPKLAPLRDFTFAKDGSLAAWTIKDKRFPQPTAVQLAAAKAQLTARRQTLVLVKSAVAAKFATLTVGEQAFYRPVMDAVMMKLAAGDLASAKQIIATAPTPTASLQVAQTAMLAAFPQ